MCGSTGLTQEDSPGDAFAKDLQDALYHAGVSDEMMDVMAARERRAFSRRGNKPLNAAFDEQLRAYAVNFMWSLCQIVQLGPTSGSQAAVIFDVVCLHRPGGVCAEHLPVLCTMIAKVMKKLDNATVCLLNSSLVPHAEQLATYLRRAGHHVPEVDKEAMLAEERFLLNTLQWEIEHTTIENWISTLVSRFNILTCGAHASKLSRVAQQSMLCARALAMKFPATADLPPLKLARGLVGLGFVCVGMLPVEVAPLPQRLIATWEQLRSQGALPSVCEESTSSTTLNMLALAAAASPDDLRAAFESAAAAVQQAGGAVQAAAAANAAVTQAHATRVVASDGA